MIRELIVLGFISLFVISCASTHPGRTAVSLNSELHLPLKVSAQTIDNPVNELFQLIELTVENVSDDWMRVSKSEVVIENPSESKLSVVLGQDLRDWAKAMEFQLQKDDHNRALLQAGLMTAGLVAAAAGGKDGNSAMLAAGSVTVVGTYAWAVSDVIRQSYKAAEQSEKTPENHFYQSFSVPGKMFLRKWVLINKPVKNIVKNLVIKLDTVEGKSELFQIKL